MITESFLNQKAKFYAKYLWNLDLDIPVKINNRLRSTHGQLIYSVNKCELQISKNILDTGYFLDDTLLHELCHWYCHKANIDYRDYSKPFETELERIGASSTETTEEIDGRLLFIYKFGVYKCTKCNKKYETNDYLGEKTEHGNEIKQYFCCNEGMKFSGIKNIHGEFVPNEKILKITNEFNRYIKNIA